MVTTDQVSTRNQGGYQGIKRLGLVCCESFILTVFIMLGLCSGDTLSQDAFRYDYSTLRMGGMIFAGTMLVIGLIVLLREKIEDGQEAIMEKNE
ncbi:hypothetical protein GDO86_012149 [Hymenochirus boettgeri]|uniref:FXYD domain-containing ion transport regulator n=1 Tax=Hymenochirus boettgeri TaxID=247094 RepID=A0A8T2IL66_9PIPI|nr:hypothetical protein GDO86_012149 [Hymenochirus boettgeri]